ncbi:MAG: DUF2809 domain-containing protein [Clostridiales bacterium]|nr:DUF2809 domain-containing protein [Clostridiales bacterium]
MSRDAYNSTVTKRLYYLIIFITLMIIEVLIAVYVHDSFIRPYVGDILVMGVLYTLIRVITPERCPYLPYLLFAFATIIEILQYFEFASILDFMNSKLLRIVLGATFDMKDILCYAIGTIIIVIINHVKVENRI